MMDEPNSLENKYIMEDEEIVNKLLKRIEESLQDDNGRRGLQRLVYNVDMLSTYLEANGALNESSKAFSSLKTMNKKINMTSHSRAIDNALVFVFLKMLSTVPTKTKAYKLGLIDHTGKLIRKPKTKEEEDSISNLDLLMFKIRQWLAGRVQYLTSVSWIKGVMGDVRLQNYLSNVQTVTRQYVVQKLNDELYKVLNH